jgi:DNA-binding GntR family transcriptional regulator
MPKTYGVQEKDKAAEYIVNCLLAGDLKSGDRVDRNEMAAALGMSRVPVQEAIVQLERDGILSSHYHRGVFVEDFDAEVIVEHHQVYGLLSGEVAARASSNPTPRLLKELRVLMQRMRTENDPAEFEDLVWEFRRTLNHEYAGPRLRAGIRSFQTFMPTLFWLATEDNRTIMLLYYETEYNAIRQGNADAARAACMGRSLKMAEIAIRELVRRGVLPDEGYGDAVPADDLAPALEAMGTETAAPARARAGSGPAVRRPAKARSSKS